MKYIILYNNLYINVDHHALGFPEGYKKLPG